jgi:hypothetical protein
MFLLLSPLNVCEFDSCPWLGVPWCCSNAIRSHYVKHQSINYFLGPSRGKCACGKCECAEGHTGNNCGCPTTNTTCLASDGVSSLLDYVLYYLYVGLWSYL